MSENTQTTTEVTQERSARPRRLPFTKKQRKTLERYKMAIAIEIMVIIVLVALRWFVSGWWIEWDTDFLTNLISQSQESTEPGQQPDENGFLAPEFDPNAQVGVPNVTESMGWAELSVSEGYNVHVCGILNADASGKLPVYFSSDADNRVWVKLRVIDSQNVIIGESGILKPGEYVESIQLLESAKSGAVTLQVMGYEPETYYSAGTVGLTTNLVIAD